MSNLTISRKAFVVDISGRENTDNIIEDSGYLWKDKDINNKNFPIPIPTKKIRKESVVIEVIKFRSVLNPSMIADFFQHFGLMLPDYEHAIRFGHQHPNQQRIRPTVFICRPAIILFCTADGRGIGKFDTSKIGAAHAFAGIRL